MTENVTYCDKHVSSWKCIFCSVKLIHKLDNLKFTKSMKTMEILHDKSKLRETILLVKDVITLDPNTRKSNATANSSSPCPGFPEAMIPKSTFHGH